MAACLRLKRLPSILSIPSMPPTPTSTLSCASGAGWKNSAGALFHRVNMNMGWIAIAAGIIAFIVILALPAKHDWNTRPFSDPMVVSHYFFIFPLVVAVCKKMYYTAAVICISFVASMFYHIFMEDDLHFAIWDAYLASFILVWMVGVFALSFTLCPDKELVVMIGVVTALAASFYIAGFVVHGDNRLCLHWRLHPMWHVVAYAAMGLVLLNFNKAYIKGQVAVHKTTGRITSFGNLSTKPWLRSLQTFSW